MSRAISLLFYIILFAPFFESVGAEPSPFDFAEPNVERSALEAKTLKLAEGEAVIDFDVSPINPEAAILIKLANGNQKIVFWKIGLKDKDGIDKTWEVPAGYSLSSIAWHPLGSKLFFMATHSGQQEILITDSASWKPTAIFKTKSVLRRLVIGPRPFESGYRVFFGVQKSNGKFSTHSITENGKREYAVLDSVSGAFKFADADEQPNVLIANSALPSTFHPAGHFMIWEDDKHCFQKAEYGSENWSHISKILESKSLCNGSLTYTPNGIGLLHWENNANGVTLIYDRGQKNSTLAKDIKFISTPSSVPDGRGLVGVTKNNGVVSLEYVLIDVPLADVSNAWMFLESAKDRELLQENSGLFRLLKTNQLYEIYDSESYACGSYDRTTPSRPYFVTTDIFWELYSSAFEGIFILSERQAAVPKFWDFVQKAHQHFKQSGSKLKLAKIFEALSIVQNGKPGQNVEAQKILKSQGKSLSFITNEDFDFENLKPRSHYTVDSTLQNYFRASKYLMQVSLDKTDIESLRSLPAPIIQAALFWIKVYEPFIAPSRRALVWNKENNIPKYASHSDDQSQVFPLSWGFDNEILNSTVYHDNWPAEEQVAGRILPSGLDLATVFGSKMAESILEESGEFKKYPNLQKQINKLKSRYNDSKSDPQKSLYQQWINGLATQWSEEITSPEDVIQKKFWFKKRIQTGLASWATLRHATVLVNERSAAECGEAGFEQIILRPPRGYVEPDVKTLDAIAGLFNATADWVKENGNTWKGETPKGDGDSSQRLKDGVVRRLIESRDKILLFRDIAKKQIAGIPLTNKEYEEILYVGRAAEHNFLIFKSLAQKDFALSTPDPIAKIVDVAGPTGNILLAGVGDPIEWDQIVPFFGRKQIVKGSSYSYYELTSTQVMTDQEWRKKVPSVVRPDWIKPLVSPQMLSCPARDP